MSEDDLVFPISGVQGGKVLDNGEAIAIGVVINGQVLNLSLRHHLVDPFIATLMCIREEADKQRSQNPLHSAGPGHGLVFALKEASVAHSLTSPGEVVLTLVVESANGGRMTHRLSAPPERLWSLATGILERLQDQTPPPPASH